MNLIILSLIVLFTIASPEGGLGIFLGMLLIYFVLADDVQRKTIEMKFKTWSWYDWRV